jgi:hypothetical protein
MNKETCELYINGQYITHIQDFVNIENRYYPTDLEKVQMDLDNYGKIDCWVRQADLEKLRDR